MTIIENLAKAINTMETDMLRETLIYILKIYVIDRGLSYEGIQDMGGNSPKAGKGVISFTEIIRDLKNHYSMKELDHFSIEGESVFISIEGKKYQLTEEIIKNNQEVNDTELSRDKLSRDKQSENGQPSCGRFGKLEMD
ncbi:MAG: hypothetical protein JXB88_04750 [Spirochaetales bacterium]|nr:hypothetical protein [Spirochaetales bacterium]